MKDMVNEWASYLWLALVALSASSLRLPDILKDAQGKTRWGMLFLQFPTAFIMAVLAKSAEPIILHFLPYAGPLVVYGVTACLVMWGPLAAPKLIDAIADRIRGGKG